MNFIFLLLSNRIFFLITGIILSLVSSLEVQDMSSNFWNNDQGLFINLGLNSSIILEPLQMIRYNIFLLKIKLYYLIFKTPYFIVVFHKLLIIFFFIFLFSRYLIKNYGIRIHLYIFLSISYLNLFFLREAFLVLIGLGFLLTPSLLINRKSKINEKILNLILTSLIFFNRPQSVFVYLKPRFSFLFFIYGAFVGLSFEFFHSSPYIHDIFYMDIDGTSIFGINNLSSEEFNKLIIFIVILFLVHVCVLSSKYNKNFFSFFFISTGIIYIYIFSNENLIEFYLEVLNRFYWYINEDFFYNFFISLYSINPINKLNFYFLNNLELEFFLIFFPSIVLIVFLIQILLSFFHLEFQFEKNRQLCFGIFLVITSYSILNVPMDIRIFLAMLSPFFIYLNKNLLSTKFLFILTTFLSIPSLLKIFFIS